MTRKDTRNTSVLRGIAPFIAVLTVMIGLAALAQMTSASRPPARLRHDSLKTGAPAQTLGYIASAYAGDIRHAAATHLRRNRHAAMNSNPPIFLPTVAYNSGGANTIAIAVADVNGDGKPDLLVVNECGDNSCSLSSLGVLRGKGDGTFGQVTTYRSIGSLAVALAAADLNRDGKPDVVVVNTLSNTVDTLLGNGDGTFQPTVTYSSGGTFATAVEIADVNGDGNLDLLVTNDAGSQVNGSYTTLDVSVLLGNGEGTFQGAVAYDSSGTSVSSIAVGDVNRDGKPDLVVAIGCGGGNCDNAGVVGVLIGNGDGTFPSVVTYGSGATDPGWVAVGDVNGDGSPDLVVANKSGSVGVLMGNGDGTFQPAVTYSSNGGQSVKIADVNGDGKPDLVMVAGGSVVVLLGNGNGTFQGPVTFDSGGTYSASLAVADLNRDGRPDLAVANQLACSGCGRGSVGVLLKDTEATTAVLTTSGSPSHVGQAVTFTADVKWIDGPVPDGELVTFFDGLTTIGTGATASGTATFTTSLLTAKTHTIKASYPGDFNFKPSSGVVTQVVEKYPTTTSLTSSPNPSQFGQAVTFTAHITSSGPAPTGKVKFLDGTTSIGSVTLSGGVAKLTKSTLAVGTHPITADYLSDAFSAKSTSPVLNQVVQ